MSRILVVDDEPKILRLIGALLEELGHSVERCSDCREAQRVLAGEIFDLMISDVRLPDGSGVDLLEQARQISPELQVILITAYGTIPEAVRAMKHGAFDYIQKPFEMEALARLVARALDTVRLREELLLLRGVSERAQAQRCLVGQAPAMKQVTTLINKVAPTPTTVLIQGESGTGKELVAESIHRLSQVQDRPLLKVNCLAIPSELMESELFGHVRGAFTGAGQSRKGWFELADGGTLFLDEIADLPLALQGKLLRALEDCSITRVGSSKSIRVNVRILTASNRDLRQRISAGTFREDLFYRLNVFPIELPPLRERREDIPELCRCLLLEIASRIGCTPPAVSPEALEVLGAYHWPGNVRELRNILERAAILAGSRAIGIPHLPAELFEGTAAPAGPAAGFLEQVERYKAKLLLEALREAGWVKKLAADRLGLTPRALSHYVSKYELDEQRDPSEE